MTRRVATALLLAAAVVGLAACGNKEKRTAFAPTEGIYVNAGDLKYQVQISRQLNQFDVEDRQYLMGLSPAARRLSNKDTWFGVFIRAENPTDKDQRPSENYRITDTLGNVFRPVKINTRANPIAYYPAIIPPHKVLPNANELAAQTSAGGELLLFRIPVTSLDNRPLQLTIGPGPHQKGAGRVDLDV